MKRIMTAALSAGAIAAGLFVPAAAQSVSSYRCSDGTRFIVGFYPQDPRAFIQIDGGEVTLARRIALSGKRYSGAGVTLTLTKDGRTLMRHARQRAAVCERL
jgi:membrane-bound inhibitor of C-type lysozyme